ncbi:hypothetical protein CCACVL1_02740, partial [Corchorus capsularis]
KSYEPHVPEAIREAIIFLQDMGTTSCDEESTELGEKLGYLHVHSLKNRILFFDILMGCLDPALNLACTSDFTYMFVLPMFSNEKTATATRDELAYGGQSDQLVVIVVFGGWKHATNWGQEAHF